MLLPTPFFERKKKLFKEPLANYSFLPLVVLYYAHAVVEVVGAIELLKPILADLMQTILNAL